MPPGSFDNTNEVLLDEPVWQANSFECSEQNFCILTDWLGGWTAILR
jgi:hypothetical protein